MEEKNSRIIWFHSYLGYKNESNKWRNKTALIWCGSVDWALACEPTGHWFNSQSGHMPGLRARSSVGVALEATTHWCFSLSLSPSLPLSLNTNKENIFKEEKALKIRQTIKNTNTDRSKVVTREGNISAVYLLWWSCLQFCLRTLKLLGRCFMWLLNRPIFKI